MRAAQRINRALRKFHLLAVGRNIGRTSYVYDVVESINASLR